MKGITFAVATWIAVQSLPAHGQQAPIDIAMLNQRMTEACPQLWEGLEEEIDPSSVVGDHWQGSIADRDAFIAFVSAEMGAAAPDAAGLAAMADDLATVAAECATQRLGLLDGLIQKLPNDALAAIDAVSREMQAGAAALGQDGFLVGDIRMTGRATAAEGWVFLTGQSIGNVGSTAELQGEEYEDLFNLARTWAPNTGSESFAAGNVVVLPDMRGRVVAGTDSMGGVAADRLTDAAADTVGGGLGSATHQLSATEIPSHSHGMSGAGNHSHSYEDVRPVSGSSMASGSGRGTSSSSKTTAYAGHHTHVIHSSGGDQPHPIVQPTIVFNVEMKFM